MLTTRDHPNFQTPIDNQIDGKTVNSDELIIDLLAADRPLLQIAQTHKLSLSQLTVWYAQPAVRAMLDALDELATRRAQSTAAHARHAALIVLKEQAVSLCETPRALELAGKAARLLARNSPTTHAASPRDPSTKPRRSPKSLRFPLIPLSALSTQSSALPPPHSALGTWRSALPSDSTPRTRTRQTQPTEPTQSG